MTDRFDDELRSAMHAEARRSRPDPRALETVMDRLDTPRWRQPAALGAAAAALILLGGVAAALLWLRDDPEDQPVVVEPPPTTAASEPDATTTTTEPDDTTTTSTDPGEDVVVDPIDMGPIPSTRDEPPETFVAVLADGRLVEADTATGEVIEELAFEGDPNEKPDEGGPYFIADVARAPDGSHLWYAFCCEPAAGALFRIPELEGQTTPNADYPMFTLGSEWFGAASMFAGVWSADGDEQRWWDDPDHPGFSRAVLSPDGQRLVVEPWDDPNTDDGNPMLVVDTDRVRDGQIVDDDPDELPNDRWTLPTFRRDGLLLVAGEGGDGSESPMLVDIDTGELIDPGFSYGATPVMQRFDGSGEWLLALVTDDAEGDQSTELVWFGPDGQQGTIPGDYISAAW
ncbi:MAG: hypothetical protein ACLFWR_13175 [Acidimicrobiales bacterium]